VVHLRESGFEVEAIDVSAEELTMIRAQNGVTPNLSGCHTALLGDLVIEGHVPADDINRLLAEGHDGIRGIAVPGMPMGSPGMEGPNPVEYEVIAYGTDGSKSVYATRQGQSTPQ